jgi:hypothetical protein
MRHQHHAIGSAIDCPFCNSAFDWRFSASGWNDDNGIALPIAKMFPTSFYRSLLVVA